MPMTGSLEDLTAMYPGIQQPMELPMHGNSMNFQNMKRVEFVPNPEVSPFYSAQHDADAFYVSMSDILPDMNFLHQEDPEKFNDAPNSIVDSLLDIQIPHAQESNSNPTMTGFHRSVSNPHVVTRHYSIDSSFDSSLSQSSFQEEDRKFTCPRCDKRYRNMNGLKYHLEHVHSLQEGIPLQVLLAQRKKEIEAQKVKPFECQVHGCDKRYKNPNGLKYHMEHFHDQIDSEPVTKRSRSMSMYDAPQAQSNREDMKSRHEWK